MNLFGFRCFHCNHPLAIGVQGICSHCQKLLKPTPYCRHCGMSAVEFRNACGYCLKNEPKWHKLVRVNEYRAPLSHWVHQFKFQQQYWWDQALARQLLLAIKQAQRDRKSVV